MSDFRDTTGAAGRGQILSALALLAATRDSQVPEPAPSDTQLQAYAEGRLDTAAAARLEDRLAHFPADYSRFVALARSLRAARPARSTRLFTSLRAWTMPGSGNLARPAFSFAVLLAVALGGLLPWLSPSPSATDSSRLPRFVSRTTTPAPVLADWQDAAFHRGYENPSALRRLFMPAFGNTLERGCDDGQDCQSTMSVLEGFGAALARAAAACRTEGNLSARQRSTIAGLTLPAGSDPRWSRALTRLQSATSTPGRCAEVLALDREIRGTPVSRPVE